MMQERIAEYVAKLKAKGIKGISGYELAARECSEYFDGRGIENPTKEDWTAFAEYYPQEYQRKKGRELQPITLKQNFVARGKAFYRWCNGEQTASLFEEGKSEASTQQEAPAEGEPIEEEKPVRTSLLIDAKTYKLLALLAALEDKTMTDILIAGARLYIAAHKQEAKILQGAIEARSK